MTGRTSSTSNCMEKIEEKVLNGERISDEEAIYLYKTPDILSVGLLAHKVNFRKNRGKVFYNINRHINPTNICVMSCKFCAFARKPGEPGAYAYTIEQVLQKTAEAAEQGATEIHMVGGLHPRWKLNYYLEMISAIKSKFPSIHIKGFTAVEIDWLAKKARMSIAEVLTLLRNAGLGSLPGGGAEIFHPQIRKEITAKLSTQEWLDIHRTAHNNGMKSNCTMLYGHVEHYEHRVYHLHQLRALQDATNGFNAFIPLSFQPHNNDMGISRYTFGFDDLKNLAISRIYLDNFNHIKSYWVMMGQDIAQLGLYFGANDLDGTIIQEKISNMAGGRSGSTMTQMSLENLIAKTGHIPAERDTLYRERHRTGGKSFANSIENKPPKASPSSRNVLKRIDIDTDLETLLSLAKTENIFELGKRASEISAQHHDYTAGFAPSCEIKMKHFKMAEFPEMQEEIVKKLDTEQKSASIINIDLLGTHQDRQDRQDAFEFETLLNYCKFLKNRYPQHSLTISGIKGLWRVVQHSKMSLGEAFKSFSENGISCFQSSHEETETGITASELKNLHFAAHEYDLPSISKVEISIAARGSAMWENFFQKLLLFRELQKETQGFLGIVIESARDNFITPAEFVRAVALARLAIPNIPNIISNLLKIPIISPEKGLGSDLHKAEEKLAPVVLSFGVNDLGAIPIDKIKPVSVLEEIVAAGFKPKLRDARFNTHDSYVTPYPKDLKHIPLLRNPSK